MRIATATLDAPGFAPSVLFEDADLLAIDKPSGLLVHRGEGTDPVTLTDLVRRRLGTRTVWPVHRLDRATSGIVLFARDREGARAISKLFGEGRIEKRYVALVRGTPPEDGTIDHPIARDGRDGAVRVPAVTRFARIATAETDPRAVSVVLAHPETGRRHQIRRHLKHIDHPVLGDTTYGKGPLNRAFRDRYGLDRLALHALGLTLPHPRTGASLQLHARLPDDLAIPFARMGFPDLGARL